MAYAASAFAAFAVSAQALSPAAMQLVDEVHHVSAVYQGRVVASFTGHLNDDETTPDLLSDTLVDTVCGDDTVPCAAFDVHALSVAFDTAFSACEAIPGDGVEACAKAGGVTVTVRRTIGEASPYAACPLQRA